MAKAKPNYVTPKYVTRRDFAILESKAAIAIDRLEERMDRLDEQFNKMADQTAAKERIHKVHANPYLPVSDISGIPQSVDPESCGAGHGKTSAFADLEPPQGNRLAQVTPAPKPLSDTPSAELLDEIGVRLAELRNRWVGKQHK